MPLTSSFFYDLCMHVTIYNEQSEFAVDKGWIAGAFFLGLFVGGAIAAVLVPICVRDWEKKKLSCFGKRQDDEETMLMEMEREDSMAATNVGVIGAVNTTSKDEKDIRNQSRKSRLSSFFKRKSSKSPAKDPGQGKGWLETDGEGDGDDKKPKTLVNQGMVTALTMPTNAEADGELTKQDIDAIRQLDVDQKEAKDDMSLKMLRIKLRKMKGKGNLSDPYLAEFTQKIIDNKKSHQELLDSERNEMEEELRKKHSKDPATLEQELENLQVQQIHKRSQLDKEELETIRNELLRTSGLSESEVDDIMEQHKRNMAELERRQGLEQARQARSLAERLEKRRHILEFRKLQEQQSRDVIAADVKGYDDAIGSLVQDGKLLERQKNDILDEHEKNLLNIQKQRDIDAMRLQSDLAEKLRRRREQRTKKLVDKHTRERVSHLERADKSTNSEEFLTNYQNLLQQQQVEIEETQTELDQTEIQELEKVTRSLDQKKDEDIKQYDDKMVQTLTQMGQLSDVDVKRMIKVHNLRMQEYDAKCKDERSRMKQRLQEKWEQRMRKLEEDDQKNAIDQETMAEQQEETVNRVLSSNLELSDEAREKILLEHARNMQALNNQLSRSKLRQQMSLEQKLGQRRARLTELQAQQHQQLMQRKEASQKEQKQLQDKLDYETMLYEKERKEAEDALRKRLSAETEAALSQQEMELAALIGRLEVGHARRQAVLLKQDKTLKQLQDKLTKRLTNKEQLESRIEDGRISTNSADQIIQQHYNQVEHVNTSIQQNREHQERLINEKLQAKKYKMQREIDEELTREKQEVMMARRKSGAGLASTILNNALMEQRQKRAKEELENEMKVELERNKEKLNSDLQQSLEKELQTHKEEFLNQLAAASNMSRKEMQDIASSAVQDTGRDRQTAKKLSKDLQMGVERAKSSLGMIEEDESDEYQDTRRSRPRSGVGEMYERETQRPKFGKKKKITPPKPAFESATGEKIHSAWDLDNGF